VLDEAVPEDDAVSDPLPVELLFPQDASIMAATKREMYVFIFC
jgi:hypothetical protein